ncbi:hypothetical protein COCNU_scaffold010014G000010 [Cocos nucifera]|nr:hypothetical protein [Cocos nucifera]
MTPPQRWLGLGGLDMVHRLDGNQGIGFAPVADTTVSNNFKAQASLLVQPFIVVLVPEMGWFGCNKHNYASRTECYWCNAPKDDGAGYQGENCNG